MPGIGRPEMVPLRGVKPKGQRMDQHVVETPRTEGRHPEREEAMAFRTEPKRHKEGPSEGYKEGHENGR